jgi:transposase
VEPKPDSYGTRWRTAHGDLTDEEWERIADLVPTDSGEGRMGRPAGHDTRDVVNAISDVAATDCQWRALPTCDPQWNTVHRSHLRWSRDGTWTQICDRRRLGRRQTAGMRRSRPAASMPRASGEHRRSPRREGRRGREDGLGTHDLRRRRHPRAPRRGRRGGRLDERRRRPRGRRPSETDVDAPVEDLLRCRFHESLRVSLQGTSHLGGVAKKIHSRTVEVLRGRSVGERTWSSLRNNRRLQVDCERRPFVAEGVVWAARARLSSVA